MAQKSLDTTHSLEGYIHSTEKGWTRETWTLFKSMGTAIAVFWAFPRSQCWEARFMRDKALHICCLA